MAFDARSASSTLMREVGIVAPPTMAYETPEYIASEKLTTALVGEFVLTNIIRELRMERSGFRTIDSIIEHHKGIEIAWPSTDKFPAELEPRILAVNLMRFLCQSTSREGQTLRLLHEINLRHNPHCEPAEYWFTGKTTRLLVARYKEAFTIARAQETSSADSWALRVLAMQAWPALRLRWDVYWGCVTNLAEPNSAEERRVSRLQFIPKEDPLHVFSRQLGRLRSLDTMHPSSGFNYARATREAYDVLEPQQQQQQQQQQKP